MNPEVKAAMDALQAAEAKAVSDQQVADASAQSVPEKAAAVKAAIDKAYGLK